MLLKQLDDKNEDLAMLAGMLTRPDLSARQRELVAREISAIRTGDHGERDVAYFLNHGLRDSANTLVIHDLRLELDGQIAQIDHLVISRYRFAYVIETKSLNASLQCNEAGEWTAWYGRHRHGTPVAIASPIEQARRHVHMLQRWLKANGWTTIKRVEPVVLVSPTTFVGKARARGDEKFAIMRADVFGRWWENERDIGPTLASPWLFASRYSTERLTKLGTQLVADHRPVARDWAAQFGLSRVVSEEPESSDLPTIPASTAIERPITPSGQTVVTPYGSVTLRRVGDGRYAIRHDDEPDLCEHVRRIGEVHGSWQTRFRNWLVPASELETVVAKLASRRG